MTASPQLLASRFVSVSTLLTAALNAALLFASDALAESPVPHISHTTMVVFTDRPMADDQWSALVRELHRTDARLDTVDQELSGGLAVLRGRDLQAGVSVDVVLSVNIAGDCTLIPGPKHTVTGALGWVKSVDGKIQPFIHVDCERIAEMLQPMALGMNRERKNTVMAEAMARVIAHEWIHFAKQESGHEKEGVMQPEFYVPDLLADDRPTKDHTQRCRGKKAHSGF